MDTRLPQSYLHLTTFHNPSRVQYLQETRQRPFRVLYAWPADPPYIHTDIPSYHSQHYSIGAVYPPQTASSPINSCTLTQHISTAQSKSSTRPEPLHNQPGVGNHIANPYTTRSAIYIRPPQSITHLLLVESWPPTTPQPTQCSGHNCHCGHQSFGLLFPAAPCPSPINCCTPALNLSYNGFKVVFSPPVHPTFLLNNVRFYHSINDSLITGCPPAVWPPLNPLAPIQGCITAHHTSTA
ncbi:hypothetical protein T07_12251 [Trichinella nelsoni]|uniref:Uncharacterized protein n=1 Tax=Trichinella nelsoni TaxID=6336 RepID=A0A0V0RQH4_9BILA|nr:hypothetical protein T07_12251 [Trichinella nelsoni]